MAVDNVPSGTRRDEQSATSSTAPTPSRIAGGALIISFAEWRGDRALATLDTEIRRLRAAASAFNTLETEAHGEPLLAKADELVMRMARTPATGVRGALLLLDYLDDFRGMGIDAAPLMAVRNVLRAAAEAS